MLGFWDFTQENLNGSSRDLEAIEFSVCEFSDRQRRAFNILLHNVPESGGVRQDAAESDKMEVTQVLGLFRDAVPDSDFHYFCLGKPQQEKSRPIKVVLKTVQDARIILGSWKSRKNELSGISISSDQTPA